MRFFKGLLRVVVGMSLIAVGLAAQFAWLTFCFGTVIIGILMLLFARQFLFGPFVFLCIPGYQTMKVGLAELTPRMNPEKAALQIAPIVLPQVEILEAKSRLCPTDYKVLAYVMALSEAATTRPATIDAGMSVLEILLANKPDYKLGVENIPFALRGKYPQLWQAFSTVQNLARGEVETGKGQFLIAYEGELTKGLSQAESEGSVAISRSRRVEAGSGPDQRTARL